jgi:hypothetical protein
MARAASPLPWRNAVWFQSGRTSWRGCWCLALIALMVANMALVDRSIVYATALVGQCAFISSPIWRMARLQGIRRRRTCGQL